MTVRGRLIGTLLVGASLVASCGGDDERTAPHEAGKHLVVQSDAFADGGEIPAEFSCDGDNVPPPLSWDAVTADEYAITMVDPDADNFVHWILFDIPATGETTFTSGELASIGVAGQNGLGDSGYAGPCPPEGDDPHQYVVTVYALNEEVSSSLDPDLDIDGFYDAIECCIAAEGRLTGTFGR